ncbi:unnamed protein product [Linum tenue]|uniref:Uncharacterized protein n=1 Tax=Linum tenue TaxID=586396 RepID=A0AAV0NAM2_9ROSI|nr:unnamed protein product [Linum tenue]
MTTDALKAIVLVRTPGIARTAEGREAEGGITSPRAARESDEAADEAETIDGEEFEEEDELVIPTADVLSISPPPVVVISTTITEAQLLLTSTASVTVTIINPVIAEFVVKPEIDQEEKADGSLGQARHSGSWVSLNLATPPQRRPPDELGTSTARKRKKKKLIATGRTRGRNLESRRGRTGRGRRRS